MSRYPSMSSQIEGPDLCSSVITFEWGENSPTLSLSAMEMTPGAFCSTLCFRISLFTAIPFRFWYDLNENFGDSRIRNSQPKLTDLPFRASEGILCQPFL